MSRIVTPSKPKLDAEENEEEGNKKEKSLVAQLQNSEEITDVEKEAMREALRSMTADEAFAAFDADDDGLVDFNEFRSIIPYLNVKISDAKAFRYFKMCDTRQCQKIDVDDFKAALFACDPVSTFFFILSLSTLLHPCCSFPIAITVYFLLSTTIDQRQYHWVSTTS